MQGFIAVSDETKLPGLCILMLDPDVFVHLLIVAVQTLKYIPSMP